MQGDARLAFKQGQIGRAQRSSLQPIAALTAALLCETSPVPLKYALELLGSASGACSAAGGPKRGLATKTELSDFAANRRSLFGFADRLIECRVTASQRLVHHRADGLLNDVRGSF